MDFPGGSGDKESACSADLGSISVLGRIPWRREWLPTPVFLPGEFHRQKSLAGYDWVTNTTWLFATVQKSFSLPIYICLFSGSLFYSMGYHPLLPLSTLMPKMFQTWSLETTGSYAFFIIILSACGLYWTLEGNEYEIKGKQRSAFRVRMLQWHGSGMTGEMPC